MTYRTNTYTAPPKVRQPIDWNPMLKALTLLFYSLIPFFFGIGIWLGTKFNIPGPVSGGAIFSALILTVFLIISSLKVVWKVDFSKL